MFPFYDFYDCFRMQTTAQTVISMINDKDRYIIIDKNCDVRVTCSVFCDENESEKSPPADGNDKAIEWEEIIELGIEFDILAIPVS